MHKIPIKIVELTSPSGDKAVDVMIDVIDYNEVDDAQNKIKTFKKKYFELVNKAKKIMPIKREEKISTAYWRIGRMFKKFNSDINNKFEITNYGESLERDFGLSKRYVEELIVFTEVFKKNEVNDGVAISIYRVLVWKKKQLESIGELEKEKRRLMKRIKAKKSITREEYKKELEQLVKSKKK